QDSGRLQPRPMPPKAYRTRVSEWLGATPERVQCHFGYGSGTQNHWQAIAGLTILQTACTRTPTDAAPIACASSALPPHACRPGRRRPAHVDWQPSGPPMSGASRPSIEKRGKTDAEESVDPAGPGHRAA